MTKEQEEAIEGLKFLSPSESDIETVLNMLKEKDKEIKQLKEDCKNLDKQAQQYFETTIIQSKQFNEEVEKKDKIINLMAEYISNIEIDEDICMKNIANTELCNEKYSNCKECIKQYFEQKATNNG